MKVTEVRVVKLENSTTNLKAYASVCFDGQLVVDGYSIVEKDGEVYVFMPRKVKTDKDGKYVSHNISYALDAALRAEIVDAVKAKYAE